MHCFVVSSEVVATVKVDAFAKLGNRMARAKIQMRVPIGFYPNFVALKRGIVFLLFFD